MEDPKDPQDPKPQDPKPFKAFSEDEYSDFVTNLKKNSYDEGRTAGREMTVKELKEKEGLDFEGKKLEDFTKAYRDKVMKEAKTEPNQRIQELENDLEKFKNEIIPSKDAKINELENSFKSTKIESKVSNFVPDFLANGLTKSDAVTILRSAMTFEIDENGREVVRKNGEVLKDDTLNPIGYEKAIQDELAVRQWNAKPDGRGSQQPSNGVSSDHRGIRSMKDLDKYYEKNGISPLGEKARKIASEAISEAEKAGEEFVYDDVTA